MNDIQDNSDVYTVRFGKNRIIMSDASMSEVRRYFNNHGTTKDFFIEVTHVGKACCKDTWKYIGSFPAAQMNSPELA